MNVVSIRKYDFIDALRGYAILGVVLVHSSQWAPPTSELLSQLAGAGARGVQLFFVVSALTLFLSMSARTRQERFPLRNFFIRRFFRIAPLFYLGIVTYIFIYGFSPRHFAPNGIEWWYLPLTALFMNGWMPETITSVVPGGWSIAVEMNFYLIVPYLYSHLKNMRSSLLFILGSLIMAWVFSKLALYVWTPFYPEDQQYLVKSFKFLWFFTQLPAFGVGIVLYHLIKRHQGLKYRRLGLVLLAGAFLLFAALVTMRPSGTLLPKHFLFSVDFGIFALSLYFYPSKILVNRIIKWIGKLSFSIYLSHFAILELMRVVFPGGFILGGNHGFVMGFILVLFLSSAVSAFTYWMIESPGIRFGKHLIQKFEQDAVPDSQSAGFYSGKVELDR